MKNIFRAMIIVLAFIAVDAIGSYWETKYDRVARVDDIYDGVVTFVDVDDNEWEWELEEDDEFLEVDDIVKLKMDTNNTTKNDDDIILKFEKF